MSESEYKYDDTESEDSPFMNSWKKKKREPEKRFRTWIPYPVKKILGIIVFFMILLGPATISVVLLKLQQDEETRTYSENRKQTKISNLLIESEVNLLVGDYKQSRKYAILALLENSNDLKTMLLEGLANLGLKNYKQAIENFKGALKINPKFYACHFALAICYHKLNEADNEKYWLNKADLSGSEYTYSLAAQYYELIKDYEKMLEAALLGKSRQGYHKNWYWAARAAMRNSDFDEALRIYDKVMFFGADNNVDVAVKKKFKLLFAEISYLEANYADALKPLKIIAAENPEWWEAKKLLAETYFELGNLDDALQTLKQYQYTESKYDIAYDVTELLMLRAKIYEKMDIFTDAGAQYEQAILLETGFSLKEDFSTDEFTQNLTPLATEILLKLARLNIGQNLIEEAKKLLNYIDAEPLNPGNQAIYQELLSDLSK